MLEIYTGKDKEERVITQDCDRCEDENWVQLRLEGRQPERRAYHTSFVNDDTLFIFGGHDIREGQMNTMWSLDLA